MRRFLFIWGCVAMVATCLSMFCLGFALFGMAFVNGNLGQAAFWMVYWTFWLTVLGFVWAGIVQRFGPK